MGGRDRAHFLNETCRVALTYCFLNRCPPPARAVTRADDRADDRVDDHADDRADDRADAHVDVRTDDRTDAGAHAHADDRADARADARAEHVHMWYHVINRAALVISSHMSTCDCMVA